MTPDKDVTDTRPQQFRMTEAWLHVERERVMGLAQDWRPTHARDIRDSRSAQLLGETLLRMQPSLGSLSQRHDQLEELLSAVAPYTPL